MALTKGTLLDLGQQQLDSLEDVDLTTVSPAIDDVLKWDGTKWVAGTNSQNFSVSTVAIGALLDGAEPITGYIDDLRITKSVARYRSTFTPPIVPYTG
jgi:hypothetical protein